MRDASPKTKPKLLVILGAGSSVELRMPSVGDIDSLMREWAREQAEKAKLPNYFGLLWENRRLYAARARLLQPQMSINADYMEPNYERCLGDMLALMTAVLDEPKATPLEHARLSDDFLHAHGMKRGDTAANGIYAQFSELFRKLADHFRTKCRALLPDCSALKSYQDLFSSLEEQFELGVYNLNHDTVALNVLGPHFFTGFFDGRFGLDAVQRRQNWQFLYHIHGCVHHSLVFPPEPNPVEIIPPPFAEWNPDLGGIFRDLNETPFRGIATGTDGVRRVVTSFVAGGWKLEQLQSNPFQTFYSTFSRHACEAAAILVAGYGFGDPHVNSVLANTIGTRTGRRPPVMVLDCWSGRKVNVPDDCDAIPRDERVTWSMNLHAALRIGPGMAGFTRAAARESLASPITPLTQDELFDLAEKGYREVMPASEFALFEKDEEGFPVALWFGGMLEAAKHRCAIANWLLRHVPGR